MSAVMKILNHFQQIILTDDQQNALEKLSAFFEVEEHVFILRGYAGSGKTTLIKGIIEYLREEGKAFELMAPTGRAAKILRDKTGEGQTIHRTIYNFDRLITKDESNDDHSFQYVFPIRENAKAERILIVDEASMISSRENKSELFKFGTDILLDDLLTYSGVPHSSNKLIIVGDPAQLPPVGDNASKALMDEHFKELGLKSDSITLEQVVRQDNNAILANATAIRELIGTTPKGELTMEYDETCFIKTGVEEIADQFTEMFPIPDLGQGVVIAFSNSQCLQYNRQIRERLFPKNKFVTPGDLLIITHNNYHSYDVELMNGEMALAMEVDSNTVTRSGIPVFETVSGKRIKKHVSLSFRRVKLRVEHYQSEVDCLIIDSLLNSPDRDLSLLEMKALYVDFVMRFQENQKRKEERGLPASKVGSEEFKSELKKDIYYNALRVKYGYAITCHKAQGGEWDATFVDYNGRASLRDEPLRWAYTATTRAVRSCYAANAPHVTLFSRFAIGDIQNLSKVPVDAFSLDEVPVSPFHTEVQHRAKSLKYWEVIKLLEGTPFQLKKVSSLGDFQERYTIAFQEEEDEFDTYHNAAGIFQDFKAVHSKKREWQEEVLSIINVADNRVIYNIKYTPSIEVLERLFGLMHALTDDLKIKITNVLEKVENYYALYFLKTDAQIALIQFYFNSKGQLTRALPKSMLAKSDDKLTQLIQKLESHVV